MTLLHDIWLFAGIVEAVIGTLEVYHAGILTLWGLGEKVIRVIFAPFALLARLFDGIRNLETTGHILWRKNTYKPQEEGEESTSTEEDLPF